MDSLVARIIVVVVVSYLLGSIPTAYLVGRLRHVNIFEIGSGNMGATNVIRATGGHWLGHSGLVLRQQQRHSGDADRRKLLLPENAVAASVLAAIVAIIGHNWSLFATLLTGTIRGGKGAATAFGTLLLIMPLNCHRRAAGAVAGLHHRPDALRLAGRADHVRARRRLDARA